MKTFSDHEKLAEIKLMIRDLKTARMTGTQLEILCAIASDMESRLPREATKAFETLDKKVAYCLRRKTPNGYDRNALAHLGDYVVGFWPTLRAALVEYVERGAIGENHANNRLPAHTESK